MPRYEFSEGSSNKFWEITLSGTSYTTTYGRIGTTGQTTIKTFGSDAEARREHDKIVAEKVKKGYRLVGGDGAAGGEAPVTTGARTKAGAASPAGKSGASGEAGPRRFELAEGSSSKFWEIWLEGGRLLTRFGKIGSAGQKNFKDHGSAAEAATQRDRLIAEKIKKGYEEKGGGAAAGPARATAREARNPELEKAIIADPFDREAYAVYADWLQEQGDPRGELIALHLAGKDKAARSMIDAQADYFLGPLAAHQKCYDGDLGNNARSNSKAWVTEHQQAFLWKNGFIHRLRLAHDSYADEEFKGSLAEILEMVLRHPSGRFIVQMNFNSNGDPNEDDLDDLLTILGKKAPPTLRKIIIGDNVDQISWYHAGNLGKLWKGVPNLTSFEIEAGEFQVGNLDAPGLERAIFKTGGLSKSSGKSIANARIPSIQFLDIWYGDEEYGGDCTIKEVLPLLGRTDLPSLTHLGLKNSLFSNDIARALPGSKLLAQLKELDLSMGTMTDEGAEALAERKDAFKHLELLDLTRNFLTKKGVAAVKGIAKKVVTASQEQPDDWDDEPHYYVAVAE